MTYSIGNKMSGKTLLHIWQTYEFLKNNKKVVIATGAINAYCDLFKRVTGEYLSYNELKYGHYDISLKHIECQTLK